MSSIPLRLGVLNAASWKVIRSGIRWLREDGQLCKRGDALGYCNIGVIPGKPGWAPFLEEMHDFQVVFLAPASGRLRKAQVSFGGFLDRHQYFQQWEPDRVIGQLEFRPGERGVDAAAAAEMPLLMLAGRRVTDLADDRSGLLSGWHDRARVWHADARSTPSTILSLGICEQSGIFRGESDAFLELASLLGPSAHIVWTSDDLLVPSARVLLDQLRRTSEDQRAIALDVTEQFFRGTEIPVGPDWMFLGGLLSGVGRSPLVDEYDLLTRSGIVRANAAGTIVLSISAEQANHFRHRRLGYTVSLHGFRLRDLGRATRTWLQAEFDFVFRSVDEVHHDYLELIDSVRERRPAQFVVLNTFSSSSSDRFYSYAAFDAPLGRTVGSVRAKELNLMLYELARERDVKILDTDVLVAKLGAQRHLPDGVHQSGEMQAALREELVRYVS